jgi:hypothetical protein
LVQRLHEINIKERQDQVIHTGKTSKEAVGVIIEIKRPPNKNEMISEVKPNTKAMQIADQFFNDLKLFCVSEIRTLFQRRPTRI